MYSYNLKFSFGRVFSVRFSTKEEFTGVCFSFKFDAIADNQENLDFFVRKYFIYFFETRFQECELFMGVFRKCFQTSKCRKLIM